MLPSLALWAVSLIPILSPDTTLVGPEPYPKVYTLRQARKAYSAGKLELWGWYLVNMYPQSSDSVVSEIASRGLSPDSTSILVRRAFDEYFRPDPTVFGSDDVRPSHDMDAGLDKAQNAEKLIGVVLLNSIRGRVEEPTLTYLLQAMHWLPLNPTVEIKPGLKILKSDGSDCKLCEESNYAFRSKMVKGRGPRWLWLSVVRCTSREICDSIVAHQLYEIKGFSSDYFRFGRLSSVDSGPLLIMRIENAILKLTTFCSSYSSANEWSNEVKNILSRQARSDGTPPIVCYCGGPLVEGDISLIK